MVCRQETPKELLMRAAGFLLAVALVASVGKPAAGQGRSEQAIQHDLCAGMAVERFLPSGGRADCLSDRFAIEVDFSEKWPEAIGQALYYAAETGKQPGIILVCRMRDDQCLKHSYRLCSTLASWQLPITVWECDDTAVAIDEDCVARSALPGF